jgi:nucleotide-binding universal stress UspA family protein
MERAAKGEMAARLKEMAKGEINLRKILVPVDFSDCSRKALQYAIPFAHAFKAELLLLHVLEPYLPYPEMTALDTATLQAESREYGEKGLRKLQQSIGDEVVCKIVLRLGKPHREIVEAAGELAVDLIIISTHGYSGLSRVMLGSTTERVVRSASCPVLGVREMERDFVTPDSPTPALQEERRVT